VEENGWVQGAVELRYEGRRKERRGREK